jgi:Protein of unknown function (DUF2946)
LNLRRPGAAVRLAAVRTDCSHFRRLACIALIAALALALVPTLSRALATQPGKAAWAEVCTTQGLNAVAADAGDAQVVAAGAVMAHLDHCQFCILGAILPGVPTTSAAPPLLVSLTQAMPARCLVAARTLRAWTRAPARAPPLVS